MAERGHKMPLMQMPAIFAISAIITLPPLMPCILLIDAAADASADTSAAIITRWRGAAFSRFASYSYCHIDYLVLRCRAYYFAAAMIRCFAAMMACRDISPLSCRLPMRCAIAASADALITPRCRHYATCCQLLPRC